MNTEVLSKQENNRLPYSIKAGPHTINVGHKTVLMGIMNITPDSFSHDGYLASDLYDPQLGCQRGLELIKAGADILDIGGESSRPGSLPISADEECERIIPTIKLLAQECAVPISVDTYKLDVAKEALSAGASMINNIKGAQIEDDLIALAKEYNSAICLMHMNGTPETMQQSLQKGDITESIIESLAQSIEKCLSAGIANDQIIIDPGIGFGKSVEQNLEILSNLKAFNDLNQPILVGTSNKSFIGEVCNKEVEERLWGTAATVSTSIINGAHIVRVHDVKEMKDVSTMTDAILNTKKL